MFRGTPCCKLVVVAAVVACLLVVLPLYGQVKINGVPASVTSFGFGGNPGPQGVPASVTSLGFGQVRHHGPFFNEPDCCINPLFPRNPKPPFFRGRHHGFPGGVPVVSVPYYYPVIVEPVDDTMESSYGPGPTIFDRRGSDRSSVAYERDYDERLSKLEKQLDEAEARSAEAKSKDTPAAEAVPAREQPATILVFRDGHSVEVTNYAIVGDTLFDFSTPQRKKIALSELDMTATRKQNEDRGVDFSLPAHHSGS
jgi:hypothetical protein